MESTTPRGTRTGFTTGACAAAAARAAAQGLETGQVPDAMESLLPNGQRVRFDVHDRRCDAHSAHAMVVKFAERMFARWLAEFIHAVTTASGLE